MIYALLCIVGITSTPQDSISVRIFSLVTHNGENVLHEGFDRRQLGDKDDKLSLQFQAVDKQFEFDFHRSYPIFAPNATIKITGSVREHRSVHAKLPTCVSKPLFTRFTKRATGTWKYHHQKFYRSPVLATTRPSPSSIAPPLLA